MDPIDWGSALEFHVFSNSHVGAAFNQGEIPLHKLSRFTYGL